MRLHGEGGVAMVIAMMALLLMTALGVALVLSTSSETIIATAYRSGSEALYAADAIVERAMDDLLTVTDWNRLLADPPDPRSSMARRTASERLPGGSTIDLTAAVNMANCGKPSACSTADLAGNATGDRLVREQPGLAVVCLRADRGAEPGQRDELAVLRRPDGGRRSVRRRRPAAAGRSAGRKSRSRRDCAAGGGVQPARCAQDD